MIKTLNMLSSGDDVPLADERKKFSRMMLIEQIEEHPDFKVLYKINSDVLSRITNSMRSGGFDDSQPVHIWLFENHKYLIDGYTRYTACRAAGITSIPVFEHRFKTFDETYKYVLSLQVNRRNLDSDELLRNVAVLTKCDFVRNAEGNKAAVIANTLGVCQRTAERAISVEKNADDEMRAQIESGALTVNKAYKQLHEKTLNKKAEAEKGRVKELVARIAYYVLAEMKGGFTPEMLLDDEDFKDALENPEGFELPENDIQVLVQLGISEQLLRGTNDCKK